MFTGNFSEREAQRVPIEGPSKDAFSKFLEFLYSEAVSDWSGSEVDLLELADRFMVGSLRAECEARLLRVGKDSVVAMLR